MTLAESVTGGQSERATVLEKSWILPASWHQRQRGVFTLRF